MDNYTKQARELRQNLTDAERRLWSRIRNRQVQGVKFRRQVPIGPFVVDFVSLEKRLVVELDGGYHQQKLSYDEDRTEYLQRQSFSVLRFWNYEVMDNIDGVVMLIEEAVLLSLEQV